MSTEEFVLGPLPTSQRCRELWLQHAAGFILFEDMRGYAIEQIDPALDDVARAAALKAIDDTVHGLMMVLDGVSGGLGNSEYLVHLQTKVCLTKRQTGPSEFDSIDLHKGDGMCMGFHQWLQGDFGEDVVAVPHLSARKS